MTTPAGDTAVIVRSILIELEPALEDVDLTLDDSISDLGVESLAIVAAIGHVEDHFGVTFPDDELTEVDTLGDFVRLVDRHRKDR